MSRVLRYRAASCAAAFCLLMAGCVSRDQVRLPNPARFHIDNEFNCIAPLDPECHGYHSTCWQPWCADCPSCPPPSVGGDSELPTEDTPTPAQMPEELPAPPPSKVDAAPQHDEPKKMSPSGPTSSIRQSSTLTVLSNLPEIDSTRQNPDDTDGRFENGLAATPNAVQATYYDVPIQSTAPAIPTHLEPAIYNPNHILPNPNLPLIHLN
jgi:hypothetical protein